MISFQVLGRLELKRADGGALHSVLAQPKRQGLLAYLAVAVPRGYHRRDTLIGLLWPDRDDESARAALSKAVHHLRQALGAETVLSRGHGDVGLDWHRIWCDAAGFEDALDRGALAEALALYQGDLLPGFYIEDAPEFEHWLERERSRLRGRAAQAARELSEREEAGGNRGPALDWARRASLLDPLDEIAVRRVMVLLDRSGDRADAARVYDELATRLRTELDVEPAPETTALMETIRNRRYTTGEVPRVTHDEPRADTVNAVVSGPSAVARRPSTAAILAGVAAGIAIVVLAGWAIVGRDRPAPAADAQASVAVLPFAILGVPASEPLGESMVTLVSDRLNHSGVLRAIDSRAVRSIARPVSLQAGPDSARALVARFHPAYVLLGEMKPHERGWRIDAALFDSVARESVARASVTGPADSLAKMAADLAAQLLETRPTRRAPMWDRAPGLITPSVPAMRAFLAGEKAYVDGHFADAARNYRAAVDADTSFALAYFNLSRAANWMGDYSLESFAIQRAYDHRDRLTTADQLLVRAWYAYGASSPLEAERLSRLIVVNAPDMADGWYALAEARFHWGPSFGWTRSEAREAYEHAGALTPTASTLVHLARLAAADGNARGLDSLVRRALALGVDDPQSLELRGLRAYAFGDRAEQQRLIATIGRLDDNAAFSVSTQLAANAAEYAGSGAIADVLRQPRRALGFRTVGAVLAAELAMTHGRADDARRALTPGSDINASRALEYRAALAVMPFRRLSPAATAALRDTLRNAPRQDLMNALPESFPRDGIAPARRSYLLGLFALRAGDTADARHIADELETRAEQRNAHNYEWHTVQLLRAELLHAAGKPAEALAALGEPRDSPVLPNVMDYPLAHERFLRAELARELGRWTEALRWYDTFPDPGAYDLPYLAVVHAAKGAVHERLGNKDAARASYQRALALWANADSEFAPLAASAREHLTGLR